MKRKDFGNDNDGKYIDKEPGESTFDLKAVPKSTGQLYLLTRKELEIGLQAAHRMVNDQTQTYYNRSVNAITTYNA